MKNKKTPNADRQKHPSLKNSDVNVEDGTLKCLGSNIFDHLNLKVNTTSNILYHG